MFRGNPRKPGSHSFENIRFVLDDERMSRLRRTWEGKVATDPNSTVDTLKDKYMIAHLCSDDVTGLYHEMNVLTSMNILSIPDDGRLTLAEGWEGRVPHMMLIEMQTLWGTEEDTNNLYCIHDRIKSSLAKHWEHTDDEGWRQVSIKDEDDDIEDDDKNNLAFDDVEYQLREQIFTENFYSWANEKSGMGEFGI
jgi:hypothetical protein